MRILYVITQADGGGAQKYTLALARHFSGAIAAGNEADKLFTDAQRAGLDTFELVHLKRNISPWHDIMAIWEIRHLIKIYRPDIVHLNSSKAGVLGSFAAMGTKTKVIFTAHGFIFNEPLSFAVKTFYLALEKVASGYRDFIITVSNADEQSALKNSLIAQNKIITVYNGLEQINFLPKDQAKTELKITTKKLVIGCVANFYKTKGVDILIDAIGLMDELTKSKIEVVLIGNGPEIENLKLKIEKLRLTDTVKMLGRIDGISKYLKAFDIFVMPSRKEGFSYALLEAMQAGLPIITTDVGGNKEALNNAGILVKPENSQALAKAIDGLVLDEKKRNTLSQETLERSKIFTEEKMFAETEKIYKKVLAD